MAEGGTIKAQLDHVTHELEEEMDLWQKDRLPSATQMFRMGDGEFQHHCHTETLVRIVKEVLGVTEDQMTLIYRRVVLEEMRTLRVAAREARRRSLQDDITRGINVIKPPPDI